MSDIVFNGLEVDTRDIAAILVAGRWYRVQRDSVIVARGFRFLEYDENDERLSGNVSAEGPWITANVGWDADTWASVTLPLASVQAIRGYS